MKKILVPILTSVTLFIPYTHAKGIPLEQATITRIINDVRILDPKKGIAPAQVSRVIKDDMGVKTGIKSRAELLFQDNTLTRLGAESYFTFRPGTREMSLDSGTMLLQVPKDHGGATIRAASVTASITGTTILLENIPGKSVKALVLEGSLRLSLNNRMGEALSLQAGKMIILRPGDRKLPEPVTVDLRRLIKTSSLVNPELFTAKNKPAPLPSMPLIAAAIAEQDKQLAKGKLQDTNLVILGKGTRVVAASRETMRVLAGIAVPTEPEAKPSSTSQRPRDAAGDGGRDTDALAGSSGAGTVSVRALQNIQNAVTAGTASTTGRGRPPVSETAGTPPSGTINSSIMIGSPGNPASGDFDFRTPVLASTTTGDPGSFVVFGNGATRVDTRIEVSSNSPARRSTSGGWIHIQSEKADSGTGIEITNTSQLLALLNAAEPGPGGRIEFVTAGSKILVGGTLKADRGTISIANDGPGGEIRLQNANLAAGVIQVGAVRPGGILRIGDSHLSADNLLKLYGGSGTGGVHFTGNTLLDGSSLKYIAGKTVQIDSGRIVTIGGGPATVFTDLPNYSTASGGNGSTSGQFQRQEAPGIAHSPTLLPFASRP